jgi:hypothetical protein
VWEWLEEAGGRGQEAKGRLQTTDRRLQTAEGKGQKAEGGRAESRWPAILMSADETIREVAQSLDDRKAEVFVLLARNPDGTLSQKYVRHQSGKYGGAVPSHWEMQGCTFVHNHPSGLLHERKGFGTSFSTDDIRTFFTTQLAEIVATSPRRLYRIKASAIAPAGDAQSAAFGEAAQRVDAWLNARVASGLTASWKVKAIRNHLIWKRFSKALGIQYTFERKGG